MHIYSYIRYDLYTCTVHYTRQTHRCYSHHKQCTCMCCSMRLGGGWLGADEAAAIGSGSSSSGSGSGSGTHTWSSGYYVMVCCRGSSRLSGSGQQK